MKVKFKAALIVALLALVYVEANIINSGNSVENSELKTIQRNWEILNFDGDVSLSTAEDARFWNPHIFGFDGQIDWNVNFGDEVTLSLKTLTGDGGHLATGMWWTTSFRQGRKIPIYNGVEIQVDFDIKPEKFVYEGPNDWLRIALACAVQRGSGEVIYTEMDILDSPNTQKHPSGNIQSGGDIVYRYGDVVEFKVDECPLNTWKHYTIDLRDYFERAWGIEAGDSLESVYIVIESDRNPVVIELSIDNFWIRMLS